MRKVPQYVCGVIPPHILDRVAAQTAGPENHARATLEHMREVATERAQTLIDGPHPVSPEPLQQPRKRRNVYDAGHAFRLPGKLVMSEHGPRGHDVEVNEAYGGSGATYDFFAEVFGRRSIDNHGIRLDSTVHYGQGFSNAMWNGEQMIYGDGDGEIFHRFTASLDVIGHELTHGVTQYSAALGYTGQTGALNEHLSDAFGVMVKQYMLNQTAEESDWLIGAELLGPRVRGRGIRSLAAPGTAYDDPLLGRDPQPAHLRDYVDTDEDNGGVHINSGIPNHAFYLAAVGIGGHTWRVLGRVWYVALTERLQPRADFNDFARATTDIAGELFGNGGRVQRVVANAWRAVGLEAPLFGCDGSQASHRRQRVGVAAASPLPKWRQRPQR